MTGDLDYEMGLKQLKMLLGQQSPSYLNDFRTLEARLRDNLREERLYGSNEVRRSDRAQIIRSLNDMTSRIGLEISFNDLCMESEPSSSMAQDKKAAVATDESPVAKFDAVDSLFRQLAETHENLQLIEERKTEYVLGTDIPLQLIKEERRLRARVTELTEQIVLIETVFISAGEFWMGSEDYDREACENEKPLHRVTLPAYEIAKYPITNAQYWVFVQSTGHRAPAHWPSAQILAGKEEHPVVNVSLEDARAFCSWLTKTTGWLYRLPTEEEWEKAARGPFPDRRCYPWGDEWLDGAANTPKSGHNDTTPVSAFEEKNKSPFGAVDMVGNVMEWTNSEYKPYQDSDYETMVGGTRYVVRGGCYTLPCDCTRISWRGRYTPATVRAYLGFRVVVEIK